MSHTTAREPVDPQLVDARPESSTQEDQHSSLHNAMNPIFRLPPELLVEIFLHLVLPVHNWYTVVNHLPQFPVYYLHLYDLSLVCKRWFYIIKNTPELWAVLSIHFKSDLIQLVMERSCQTLMDVDYTQLHEGRLAAIGGDQRDHPSFVPKLMEISNRLKRAVLSFDWIERGADLYLSLFRQSAPHLKELRIDCQTMFVEDVPQDPIILFQNHLPDLRVFELQGASIHWTAPYLFHLHQLSLCNIAYETAPTTAEIFAILTSCQSLEEFSLTSVAVKIDSQTRPHPISLEQLHHLQLKNISFEFFLFLLRILPLDGLRRFHLQFNIPSSTTQDTIDEVMGRCCRVLRWKYRTTEDAGMELTIAGNTSSLQLLQAGHMSRLLLDDNVEPFVDVLKDFIALRPIELHLDSLEWPSTRYEWLLKRLNPTEVYLYHDDPQSDSYTPLFQLLAHPKVVSAGVLQWEWENIDSLTCLTYDINWDEVVGMVRGRFQEPNAVLTREPGLTPQRPRVMKFKFGPYLQPTGEVLETLRAILGDVNVVPMPGRAWPSFTT